MDPLTAALGRAVQTYQAAVDDFDRETARILGINETDQRCLEILLSAEDVTPRRLATELGLSTGSVTAMLDRLERLGHLTRGPHPTDRRKSVVRVTPQTARRVHKLIAPLVDEGGRLLLERYDPAQLELIVDYLTFSTGIQQRHVQRLRAVTAPGRPRTRAGASGRRTTGR